MSDWIVYIGVMLIRTLKPRESIDSLFIIGHKSP